MDTEVGTIEVKPDELDLTHTLTPGQSFRWKKDRHGRWTGVIRRNVVCIWREKSSIKYQIHSASDIKTRVSGRNLIHDYFRLDVDLHALYREFILADGCIMEAINHCKGLRVLRQDPEEVLISYICTPANNIGRISNAIENLSREYGDLIATLDGQDYYAFPSMDRLASADADYLSEVCHLGFRCANIRDAAKYILRKPDGWLNNLRHASYMRARAELLNIRGIGLKVADCILLFSLDKDQAFPVDTHIRSVTEEHYLPELKQKTLTPRVYQQIVNFYQDKFGAHAGWAQAYLFYDHFRKHKLQERKL